MEWEETSFVTAGVGFEGNLFIFWHGIGFIKPYRREAADFDGFLQAFRLGSLCWRGITAWAWFSVRYLPSYSPFLMFPSPPIAFSLYFYKGLDMFVTRL